MLDSCAKKFYASLLTMLIFTLSFVTHTHADESDSEVVRVVYHADFADPRRFSAMLTSINNMAAHYENELQDYDMRIVFNSHGIRFLTDDKLTGTPFAENAAMAERRESNRDRLMSLQDLMSVKLELCEITRSQVNLDVDKLYEGTQSVPSGVVRLAELQHQGFAYIKVE